MQLANQLELCLHKQTQIVASAACRVDSQGWIASLPLVSLLFIVIPTPFLNFLNFIYYIMHCIATCVATRTYISYHIYPAHLRVCLSIQ